MKKGDIVIHSKLGRGKVLELCKYGGLMIDYSDRKGILVRVSHRDKVRKK